MARIRNLDDPDELRAANAAELDWVGRAPTATPASRVRDVLLIPMSTAEGDWDTHPPVSSPPVDLGRGLKLTELDHDEAELVMNACTPRGHYFFAVRQFGGLHAFVLDVDLDVHEQHHFSWDADGVVITALQLSRVVRDNGHSPEFAARIVEHEDGQKQVIPQGQHYFSFLPTFRLRDDRDWLTAAEAQELRSLLDAYWANMNTLPRQLARAISLSEGGVHQSTLERALVTLFMGLEALLNTGKHQVTKQITKRMPQLADDVGLSSLRRLCSDHFDMQIEDVRVLLRMPKAGYPAGCNFAAAAVLFNMIAGVSVCFYDASPKALTNGDRGKRFKNVLIDFFPWPTGSRPRMAPTSSTSSVATRWRTHSDSTSRTHPRSASRRAR
jgi:hypothetical protein